MEDTTEKNPRETAGFISLFTFSWLNDILKLGSKHPLEEKHLFPLEPSFQAKRLVDSLEREWLAEERSSEQRGTNPCLWRAMLRIVPHRDYIILALSRIFYSFSMNLLPLTVWLFLKSISSGIKSISYTSSLPFVICISVTSIARNAFVMHGFFKAELCSTRLKVAVVGLVYKKILSVNRCILEDSISENTINLVSNDAQVIEKSGQHVFNASFAILDILVALILLWYLVAWQALIGVLFFVLVTVYDSLAAHKSGKIRAKVATQTDKRLEIIKEIVSGIRVVKMYAWEWNFRDLVAKIRRKEISLIRVRGFLVSTIYALFFTSNAIAGFLSVTTLVFTEHSLTSFTVFTLLSILANIKFFVTVFIGDSLIWIADTMIACRRMQRLLETKPVLETTVDKRQNMPPLKVYFNGRRYKPQLVRTESFKPGKPALMSVQRVKDFQAVNPRAVLENIFSFWNYSSDRPALQNVSLKVTSGQLIGITGPVGSGKTSLLMTILGELPISSGQMSCTGKMAYVSQSPWVYSGTVRENIVFGMPFVQEKFNNIIEVCDLVKDLSQFPKRDLTEIGQRGVILSGGQRARVSLARAIYSDADIYLLDDPLSAVDGKVGKHLFEKCINGLLARRVRILVTHQSQFLQDTENIVILRNGSVEYQGTFEHMEKETLRKFSIVSQRNQEARINDHANVFDECEFVQKVNTVIKLGERVDLKEEEEDRMVGTIKWRLYWKYFRAALPTSLIFSLGFFFAVVQVLWIAPYWWVSRMIEMPHEKQNDYITFLVYGSIVILSLVFTIVSSFCFYLTALKASENLHNKMTKAVIKAPVLFFDTNPVGRILNRFSKDIGSMDIMLPPQFLLAGLCCLYFFTATILSTVVNVWLFIICVPLSMLFIYLAKYYLKSSREIRRLEAVTCTPVYSLITDTVAGSEVIRSSKMEDDFLQKFFKYQDKNTSALIILLASTRWLGFRGDLISNMLVTAVSVGALFATQSPAFAGMSLTFVLETLEAAQYGIYVASETENHMTSVERVFTYTEIDPEPGYCSETQPPEHWPTAGSLALYDLSLAYLEGAPPILNGINVCIASKEKVGVVGRTGAGKSSLVAALFRMPEPEGGVIIDDVNIKDLNLQAARRSMAVITQDPVLFSGSVRRNLDPFTLYNDHDLWSALGEVQMKPLVQQLPEQLEYKLRESGTNFSVGERQLVCLARALLHKSKIIILDEATANVDYKTDRLIQEVIRNRFKDSTVITIAHRLNTIMDYDKVLVMDRGRVVEFDKPEVLLKNKNGHFSLLVQAHQMTADH